jgi:hypothetical protein
VQTVAQTGAAIAKQHRKKPVGCAVSNLELLQHLENLERELLALKVQQRILVSALNRLYAALRAHQRCKGQAADAIDQSLYCVLQEFEEPSSKE